MHRQVKKLIFVTILILLGVSCGRPVSDPEIIVPHAPCEVFSGGMVSMSLGGSIPSNAQIHWSVGEGTLSTDNGLTTVFTAPTVTENIDIIVVASINVEGQITPKTLVCSVKAIDSTVINQPDSTAIPSTPVIPTPTNSLPVDGFSLPSFTCILINFGSYYPLLQIVQDKLDEQNGFKLELITWSLSPYENLATDEITEKIRSGEWDCLLDTLDGIARDGNYGVITAIIDESAGADQVWVNDKIQILNDIKGKRVGFVSDSTGEFMLLALLNLVGLSLEDVTAIPNNSMSDVVRQFNQGELDAIIGWEPDISGAAESGGHKLVDSSDFRYIVDVITMSQQAIESKPEIVQAFHRAWFEALRTQFDDFSESASSIATWGNNDWTFIYPETATSDLENWLTSIAQAGLGPNLIIMNNPSILYERLSHARSIWELSGINLPILDVESAIDPRFVMNLQADASLFPQQQPYNDSFSMAGLPPPPPISADWYSIGEITACGQDFEFIPNTTTLTEASQQILDDCLLPILQVSTLYVRITGSSAWPGPPLGNYVEDQIANLALDRALAVAQYLANHNIPVSRLIIDFVIPPVERQGILDEEELMKDRFVRIELVAPGQR